jgi:STAS-like domain of unknown function (DUF4325)
MIKISVAKDFTRFPAGRFIKNGDTSGEAFREKYLIPHIQSGEEILVELDGVVGYGSSFLEEAFGGLVRQTRIPATEILKKMKLFSKDPALISEIKGYIKDADSSKSSV